MLVLYESLCLLQNNNVKWPSIALLEEVEPRRLILVFCSGIDSWRCIFSLSRILNRSAYRRVLDNCEIRDKIQIHFFQPSLSVGD